MNPAAYLQMAETEARHWWSMGRRAILSKMLESLALPQNTKILEVGCGTGGNLKMLAKFGEVSALEKDGTAREIVDKKTNNLFDINAVSCPDEIPFYEQQFDLICLFDILEHIKKDVEALISLKKLLKKNGRILITVPSYQWMYGSDDEFIHHKRRYSAKELREKFVTSGLQPFKITYFNTILFPLAAVVRFKDKLLGSKSATGTSVPPALINKFLTSIFGAERFLVNHFNLPFGVSLLCVLEVSNEC